MLCQVLALSCLKNFSAQSDLVLFCVPDNKRLELEQMKAIQHWQFDQKVVNDLRINADSKKRSVLALLDLSAAFDTVDHDILMDRLENWVGLAGPVLNWFRTYLTDRECFVALGDHSSKNISMTCVVPQGSILGPLLFSLYTLSPSETTAQKTFL